MITSFDGRPSPICSFSKKELERATNNYHQDGVLHQGWSYKMYKGTYKDRAISVKKFKLDGPGEYIGEYINEVAVASQMSKHKNVLKLLGCCLETEIPTLVYEFTAGGRLYDHIFEEELSPSYLSWEIRLRIATEIADAVAYLHTSISKPIVHRVINSRTIFLDQNYVAKLFEFGFSISIPLGETHVCADVVGYFGFTAPESDFTRRYTEKSDVYSFGVVLFEILTGKRVYDIIMEVYGDVENSGYILVDDDEKDIKLYLKTKILKGNIEQLMACAELAIRCIKMNPEERPSMMEAAKELRRIRRLEITDPVTKKEGYIDDVLEGVGEDGTFDCSSKLRTRVRSPRDDWTSLSTRELNIHEQETQKRSLSPDDKSSTDVNDLSRDEKLMLEYSKLDKIKDEECISEDSKHMECDTQLVKISSVTKEHDYNDDSADLVEDMRSAGPHMLKPHNGSSMSPEVDGRRVSGNTEDLNEHKKSQPGHGTVSDSTFSYAGDDDKFDVYNKSYSYGELIGTKSKCRCLSCCTRLSGLSSSGEAYMGHFHEVDGRFVLCTTLTGEDFDLRFVLERSLVEHFNLRGNSVGHFELGRNLVRHSDLGRNLVQHSDLGRNLVRHFNLGRRRDAVGQSNLEEILSRSGLARELTACIRRREFF
ncbi:hypothetical protein HHK36_022292 [Tetracentron sinense]|uniref:Protein kinase domain-containing protein n=1 Tax=Tetracentron sinense TaxID=13715 RepID=A0A835D8P2_TETSI|nr:hypothetical protein HHK36_022292 [Tetracentron sinense]